MEKINFVTINTANAHWNRVCSHPMQTIEWAKVRSSHGIETVLIEQYEGEILEKVYLMTLHNIPHTNYKVAYIPKSQIPSDETIKEVCRFAKDNNIIFVKFEPDSFADNSIRMPIKLTKSPHPIFTKHNQLLDLNKPLEEVLASFHNKTRYNIRLAKKKGVEIKDMSNQEGYKIFERLYFETCARQKYRGHTPNYHKKIWEILDSSPEDESVSSLKSKIIVAFYSDTPLAAYQLWTFKKTIYYVYGGSDTKYKEVMAANLLMWESILQAKKEDYETFDMWGSLSKDYDKKDPWAGFTRFKEGYGTRFVEYVGSFDLVINKPLYALYNLAHSIRQRVI